MQAGNAAKNRKTYRHHSRHFNDVTDAWTWLPFILFISGLVLLTISTIALLQPHLRLAGITQDAQRQPPMETRKNGFPAYLRCNGSEELPCVVVSIRNSHWVKGMSGVMQGCTFQGKPLQCIFRNSWRTPDPEADAVWYHVPTSSEQHIKRDASHQVLVGFSMEPSSYYPLLNNTSFMDMFDIEWSYRRCAHVWAHFFYGDDQDIQNKLFADPVPYEDKLDALAYINSNCRTRNGRNNIVESIMNLSRVEVHSWGRCLRNQKTSGSFNKVHVLRRYKFCIAMENSNTVDYVTEKIWQAFESGCVPIYLGAPNILDFVPSKHSFIDFAQYNGNVSRLADDLERLMQNKTAYMEMMAWKYKPLRELSPGFQKLVTLASPARTQCQLCQAVLQQRLGLRTFIHTHCMRNQAWLRAATAGASTWAADSDAQLQIGRSFNWSKTGVWDPYNEAPLGQARDRRVL